MSRTVPFAERHLPVDERPQAEPEPAAILGPDGQPARLPKLARCPSCGAGSEHRVTSGMGPVRDVTCEVCAFEYEKELAT